MNPNAFVKICGLSTDADVDTAIAHGADALGFVLTASPRQISPEHAAALIQRIPERVASVAVFRSEPVMEAIELARAAQVGWIQLHGIRTAEEIAAVQQAGFKAIRAVRMDASAAQFADLGEDLLLIDAAIPGSGQSWDYAAVRPLAAGRNWLVAGGLSADNVAQALELSQASGVDVSSGVESTRGVKDQQKIIDFLTAAHRRAQARG